MPDDQNASSFPTDAQLHEELVSVQRALAKLTKAVKRLSKSIDARTRASLAAGPAPGTAPGAENDSVDAAGQVPVAPGAEPNPVDAILGESFGRPAVPPAPAESWGGAEGRPGTATA